jgi:hypothetical protein
VINVLLLAAFAAQAAPAAAGPAFGVQVSSFVALALREAPNDYASFVGSASYRSNAAAIAPTFATCGTLTSPETGSPAWFVCSSDWLPSARAQELYKEGAATIRASLPKAVASTSPLSGTWSLPGQKFGFFAHSPPNRPDIKSLVLSSQSYRHLAKTPLTDSFKAAIAEGLRSAPGDFADLRVEGNSLGYDDVNKNFSPGLPWCRIGNIISNPSLECFTPAFVDDSDAVFAAAKEAVTAALPVGFSDAKSYGKNHCGWSGPAKESVVLLIGSIPPRTKTYGVRIMIGVSK